MGTLSLLKIFCLRLFCVYANLLRPFHATGVYETCGTCSFLIFSGSIERGQRHEMYQWTHDLNYKDTKWLCTGCDIPAGNYTFTVGNGNTGTRCQIYSKLTQKTLEPSQWRRSGVTIVNFEHISHLVLVFLLLTLSRQISVDLNSFCTWTLVRLPTGNNILHFYYIKSTHCRELFDQQLIYSGLILRIYRKYPAFIVKITQDVLEKNCFLLLFSDLWYLSVNHAMLVL